AGGGGKPRASGGGRGPVPSRRARARPSASLARGPARGASGSGGARPRRASSGGAPAQHTSEVVSVPESGALDVVVVADTHGQAHPRARPLIEQLAPGLILHAGDIGDVAVLEPLREVAPLLAVRGNIDGAAPGFADSPATDLMRAGRTLLQGRLT